MDEKEEPVALRGSSDDDSEGLVKNSPPASYKSPRYCPFLPMWWTRRRVLQGVLLFALGTGYASIILCVNSISVALPSMKTDSGLHLDTTRIGYILAVGTAGVVVGKIIAGVFSKNVGGRWLYLTVLALIALAEASMGFVSE